VYSLRIGTPSNEGRSGGRNGISGDCFHYKAFFSGKLSIHASDFYSTVSRSGYTNGNTDHSDTARPICFILGFFYTFFLYDPFKMFLPATFHQ